MTEALPLSLVGSALTSGRSISERADIGSMRCRGSFWQLLTEATPVALPATKTLPRKHNTILQNEVHLPYENSCPIDDTRSLDIILCLLEFVDGEFLHDDFEDAAILQNF